MQKVSNERIKELLAKTLSIFEGYYEMSIFECDVADEIGITEEEYDEIMGY